MSVLGYSERKTPGTENARTHADPRVGGDKSRTRLLTCVYTSTTAGSDMVDVGLELELMRPGVYYWSTPEFHEARVALEKADSKDGPFRYEAGVEITVPASGKGDADTWLVMKTAGGKVRFKSQTTGTEEDGVSVRTSHPTRSGPQRTPQLRARSDSHSPL